MPKSAAELLAALADANIDQCDPWVPSLSAQLKVLGSSKPRAIVMNFLPRQPESLLAQSLIRFDSAVMAAGIRAAQSAIGIRQCVIAINKHDRILRRSLKKTLAGLPVRVQPLLAPYPRAHPTVLLWTLYGQRLPVGELPARGGYLMIDPVTLWALGRYLLNHQKFTHRPIEIFAADQEPRISIVELGITTGQLLKDQRINVDAEQIIRNGMMSGEEISVDTQIAATTESLSVRSRPAVENPNPCIECGWCVDHCPTDLNPLHLYELEQDSLHMALSECSEAAYCIGCGLCSYVCPTRLPLTQCTLNLRQAVLHEKQIMASIGGKAGKNDGA